MADGIYEMSYPRKISYYLSFEILSIAGEVAVGAYHLLRNPRVVKLANILVKAGERGSF